MFLFGVKLLLFYVPVANNIGVFFCFLKFVLFEILKDLFSIQK